MSRLTEDIAMHKLPASLLRGLLCTGKLVVLGDVAVQRPQEDHRHHARQEEHDHQRIQDGEPVDLPSGHLEVVVPTGCPPDGALRPLNIVGVDDLVVRGQVKHRKCCIVLADRGDAAGLLWVCPGGLGHAVGFHLETHDAVSLVLGRVGMELEVELDMVVDVVPASPSNADRETVHVGDPSAPSAPPDIPRSRRHVVHQPVHQIVVVYHALEPGLLLRCQGHLAEHLARLILQHVDLVRRVLDHVALENLAQVLHALLDRFWSTVGQRVVPVGQLRLDRSQLVHLQVNLGTLGVLDRGNSRQVEGMGTGSDCRHQQRKHL
mmetsp:Transcript_5757/g.13122  ORF Transcript_5757/g.13122 Transcript_5757/m.13122 type:complete len:320 (-) Transcript_5757:20-979(-)